MAFAVILIKKLMMFQRELLFMMTILLCANEQFVLSKEDQCESLEPEGFPCACEYENKIVNLALEGGYNNPLITTNSKNGHLYTYYFNPCGVVKKDGAIIDKECKDSTMCQADYIDAFKITNHYPLGDLLKPVRFRGVPDVDLTLTYSAQKFDNMFREINVVVICDPDMLTPKLNYSHELHHSTGTLYYFTFTGMPGCLEANATSGLSPGSVLLIIFFVLLAVYLIGGVMFNKCVRGFTGLEVIPNYEFWSDLPKLVADGWKFTITCGCCRSEESSPGYDNI